MAIREKLEIPAAAKKIVHEHKDFPGVPLPPIVAGELFPWKGWFFRVVGSKDMQVIIKLEKPTTNHAYKATLQREKEERILRKLQRRKK